MSTRRQYRREVAVDVAGRPKLKKVGDHVLELARVDGAEIVAAIRHPERERSCLWDKTLVLGTDYNDYEPSRLRFAKAPKAIPPFLVAVGELEAVVYSSDKFDGTLRHYQHDFKKSARPILAVHPDGHPLYIVGGRYHVDDRGIVDD